MHHSIDPQLIDAVEKLADNVPEVADAFGAIGDKIAEAIRDGLGEIAQAIREGMQEAQQET